MPKFTVKTRVYETEDGELVVEGDVRARFLKYGEDTELGGDEAVKVAALFDKADDRELTEPSGDEPDDRELTEPSGDEPADKEGDPGEDKRSDVKPALTQKRTAPRRRPAKKAAARKAQG